ncbi:MAG: serine/threonine-protein kinase, partial [Planctomycetota bacterium]
MRLFSDPSDTALQQHVNTCSHCQSRLEIITTPHALTTTTCSQRRVMDRVLSGVGEPAALRQFSLTGTDANGNTPRETAEIETLTLRHVDTEAVLPTHSIPHLPGYQLQQKIGQGGVGAVYRARQDRLGRNVAVKILQSQRSSDSIARFHREMKCVGRLSHPNVVQAFDAGEADGISYLVMELLQGCDLACLLRRNQPESKTASKRCGLPIADACRYTIESAAGLQAAHAAGMVHCDVKPSNLFLTDDGQIKVLDLGLAFFETISDQSERDRDTTSASPIAPAIMGTLDYLSPEQARDVGGAEATSDIYSLGCTLFTLLAGTAPFARPEHNTATKKLVAHAQEARPNVRGFRKDVPRELAMYIQKMMDVDPAKRPSSMNAVAADLQPFVSRQSIRAVPWNMSFSMLAFAALLISVGTIVIRFRDGTTMTINTDKPIESVKLQSADEEKKLPLDSLGAVNQETFPRMIAELPDQIISGAGFGATDEDIVARSCNGPLLRWRPLLKPESPLTVIPVGEFRGNRISRVATFVPEQNAVLVGDARGLHKIDLATQQTVWTIPGTANIRAALIPAQNHQPSDRFIHGRQTK